MENLLSFENFTNNCTCMTFNKNKNEDKNVIENEILK